MKIAFFDGEAYTVKSQNNEDEKVVMEETLAFSLVAVRKKLAQIRAIEPNAEIVKVKDGRYGIAF